MINASTISQAVEILLRTGLSAKTPDYRVDRAEYVNTDPDMCPWVGVYRGDVDYDVATLGSGLNSWEAALDIRLIVQASSSESGDEAEQRLEQSIKDCLDVIMADKQLSNTVDMIDGVKVVYSYNETESESLYFQEAEVTIATKVRTQ